MLAEDAGNSNSTRECLCESLGSAGVTPGKTLAKWSSTIRANPHGHDIPENQTLSMLINVQKAEALPA